MKTQLCITDYLKNIERYFICTLIVCSYYNTCIAHLTPKQEATVSFEVKHNKSNQLVLNYSYDFLTGISDTITLLNGKYKKKFTLSKPLYITIYNTEGAWGFVFLSPNYHSRIIIDCSKNKNQFMLFEAFGDGATATNYKNAIKGIIGPTSKNKSSYSSTLLTEYQYIDDLNKYCNKRDSIYNFFSNISIKTSGKDKYLKTFWSAEKTENQFEKASRLLNFIENRYFKEEEKAESFFNRYVIPTGILDYEINPYSSNSVNFYRTYLPDFMVARMRATKDSINIRKVGHYAVVLSYMNQSYKGLTKSHSISKILLFLAEGVRQYPLYLPPIDSLTRVYEIYIPSDSRKKIWETYKAKKAEISVLYAEGDKIGNFKIEDANNQTSYLKDKLTDVTIIDLWASWCGNCVEAFPYADTLALKYRNDKRVSFLRLSLDDKKDLWQKNVKRLNLTKDDTFWMERGMKSLFAKKFDVAYLPRFIIMNREGKVLKMYSPHIADTERFLHLINKYLN